MWRGQYGQQAIAPLEAQRRHDDAWHAELPRQGHQQQRAKGADEHLANSRCDFTEHLEAPEDLLFIAEERDQEESQHLEEASPSYQSEQ